MHATSALMDLRNMKPRQSRSVSLSASPLIYKKKSFKMLTLKIFTFTTMYYYQKSSMGTRQNGLLQRKKKIYCNIFKQSCKAKIFRAINNACQDQKYQISHSLYCITKSIGYQGKSNHRFMPLTSSRCSFMMVMIHNY